MSTLPRWTRYALAVGGVALLSARADAQGYTGVQWTQVPPAAYSGVNTVSLQAQAYSSYGDDLYCDEYNNCYDYQWGVNLDYGSTYKLYENGTDVTALFTIVHDTQCSSWNPDPYSTSSSCQQSWLASRTKTLVINQTYNYQAVLTPGSWEGPSTANATFTYYGFLVADATMTNNDNQSVPLCEMSCFAAVHAQSSVPYYSLNTPRSVTLVYNGDRVAVRPFVHVDVAMAGGAGAISEYRLQVAINGATERFTNGDSVIRFNPASPQTDTVRIGGQLDASGRSTGMYAMTITVTALYQSGATPEQRTFASKLMVVNERSSAIARGWTIAGIQRVYAQGDGSLLVTEGDGSATYFTTQCAGCTALTPTAPEGEYSKFVVSSGTPRTYTRVYADSVKVWFSPAGLMDSTANRFGVKRRYAYDAASRLIRIYDPYISDPSAPAYQCGVNQSLGVVLWCQPKAYITLAYGQYGLASITEPGADGGPGTGRQTLIDVGSDLSLNAFTDPDGVATRFTYDGSKRLATVTDRRGAVTTMTYDAATWKISSTVLPSVPLDQGNGGTAPGTPTIQAQSWESAGVPVASTGSTRATAPRTASVTASVTDAKGHSTSFTVDRYGQPLRVIDALGNITTITRDGPRPVAVRRPTGAVETYRYAGPLLIMAHPAGPDSTNYRYGAYAQLDSVWGPHQPFQMFRYGQRGRLDTAKTRYTATSPDYYSWRFVHDTLGRLTAVIDPAGHTTTYHFDARFGNLDSTRGPDGRYDKTVFDRFGRDSLAFTLGRTAPVTTHYDALNRVVRIYDGVNTNPYRYEYDNLYLVKSRDPLGQVFRRDVNAAGWITAEYDPADTTGWSKFISYRYDPDGAPTSWTNRRSQVMSLTYDELHRLKSRSGPGIADTFGYSADGTRSVASNAVSTDSVFTSANGWLDSSVTRLGGQRFRRLYLADAAQRLDSVDISMLGGPIVFAGRRFTYNGDTNQLTRIAIAGNSVGALVRNSEMLVGLVTYRWNGNDAKRRSIKYTSSHRVYDDYFIYFNTTSNKFLPDPVMDYFDMKYGYDSVGRIVEVTKSDLAKRAEIRSFQYTQMSELSRRSAFLPGSTCGMPPDQNDFGFNCRALEGGATSAAVQTQLYDGAGNEMSMTASSATPGTYSARSTNYYYDTGNRIRQEVDAGGTMSADPTRNRNYTTDPDGNVIRMYGSQTDIHYKWDALGHLITDSVAANARTISYEYNALGQPVRRRINGVVDRYFLWDGNDLLAELNGTATQRIAEYVYWSTDTPLAIVTGATAVTQVDYLVQNEIGNVIGAFRNSTGGSLLIDLTATYDDWGTPSPSGVLASANRLAWKGLFWEGDSAKLYLVRNRWYSPRLGRFMSEDPNGLAGGMNVYTFAGDDPINGRDPMGLDPFAPCRDCPQWWPTFEDLLIAGAQDLGNALAKRLMDRLLHPHRGHPGAGSTPSPSGMGPISFAALNNTANFFAGFGDNITFGGTKWIREKWDANGTIEQSSGWYQGGEWTGVAASVALGAGAGKATAQTAAKGLEFSHWIPNRWGGPRSLWNGKYVTAAQHALADPYRYRFMSRAWKAANPLPNAIVRQWNRLPNWVYGAGAGGILGGTSKVLNDWGID